MAPSVYISAATLLLHLLLSWVAVYQMGLGLVVSSLALSLSGWIIVDDFTPKVSDFGLAKEAVII